MIHTGVFWSIPQLVCDWDHIQNEHFFTKISDIDEVNIKRIVFVMFPVEVK